MFKLLFVKVSSSFRKLFVGVGFTDGMKKKKLKSEDRDAGKYIFTVSSSEASGPSGAGSKGRASSALPPRRHSAVRLSLPILGNDESNR